MRKSLFFAFVLVASMLAFVSCKKDDKKNDEPQQTVPTSAYDGTYVSDSIQDGNGNLTSQHTFWTVLNSKQVEIHGWGVCTWVANDHFFTITLEADKKISLELMEEPVDNHFIFYVGEGGEYLNIPDDAMLYMLRLPKPQGSKLAVTEANILGKWRTTYEINSTYNESGKKDSETKFYHSWSIWDIQANGVATAYDDPYSYNGWWVIDNEKLALYTGDKPATIAPAFFRTVELYSNFMHLIDNSYDSKGKLHSTNEQFYYKVQ